VQADADRHWPVRDGSVTVVFASRVAHLLDADHVVAEAGRVCRPGGRFVVGRIERTGVKQELRRQREALLTELGLAKGRSGRRRTEALLDAFVAAGADRKPGRTVATWTVTTTVEEVIAGWEAMPTMGGQTIDGATRAAVLDDLRRWSGEHLGDPQAPQDTTEHYILEAVRLL
jgi:SAM-dependent methyltransferase